MEPRVLPGVSIEAIRKVYGPESEKKDYGYIWNMDDYSLNDFDYGNGKGTGSILLSVKTGHLIATPDGIELGKDTFATFLQKMKDRGIEVDERLADEDMIWVLHVSFPATCGSKFRSEYAWFMDDNSATDKAIGEDTPLHSSIFLDKIVYSYGLDNADIHSEELEGQPATHE